MFRSKKESEHYSAAFELVLHEFIRSHGLDVRSHPALTWALPKRPDFLVRSGDGSAFVLEATVANARSAPATGEKKLRDLVLDEVNRLRVRGISLLVTIRGRASTQPSGKEIRTFLESHLASLDVARLRQEVARVEGLSLVPRWEYSTAGLTLEFRPVPLKDDREVEAIGGETSGAEWVDHVRPLRRALRQKANLYGKPELPLLLAVDFMDPLITGEGVEEALFGRVAWVPEERNGAPTAIRKGDGFWGSERKPLYTRVSGVLVFVSLTPWTVASENVLQFLHLNPYAQKPFDPKLDVQHRYQLGSGSHAYEPGPHLREKLGLWPGWPLQGSPKDA